LVDPVGPLLIKCYRLEERATRAESARIVGDDKDLFRALPLDHIQSNVAAAVDRVDSAGDSRNSVGVILVAHPELAAERPKAARHYSWIFNCAGLIVMVADEPDIGDRSRPVHLPDAATFTGHEHVVAERALMIEGDPGMVSWVEAASVRDGGKECGGIG